MSARPPAVPMVGLRVISGEPRGQGSRSYERGASSDWGVGSAADETDPPGGRNVEGAVASVCVGPKAPGSSGPATSRARAPGAPKMHWLLKS